MSLASSHSRSASTNPRRSESRRRRPDDASWSDKRLPSFWKAGFASCVSNSVKTASLLTAAPAAVGWLRPLSTKHRSYELLRRPVVVLFDVHQTSTCRPSSTLIASVPWRLISSRPSLETIAPDSLPGLRAMPWNGPCRAAGMKSWALALTTGPPCGAKARKCFSSVNAGSTIRLFRSRENASRRGSDGLCRSADRKRSSLPPSAWRTSRPASLVGPRLSASNAAGRDGIALLGQGLWAGDRELLPCPDGFQGAAVVVVISPAVVRMNQAEARSLQTIVLPAPKSHDRLLETARFSLVATESQPRPDCEKSTRVARGSTGIVTDCAEILHTSIRYRTRPFRQNTDEVQLEG